MSTKNVTLHDENGNVLLPATKTSRITDANGTGLDTLLQQAGQVKSISVNGVTQTIDANGNVNIASADGVGIASVVQTTTSSEDGGTNVITVTKTDNTTSTFSVKNGSKGSTGATGPQGERGLPGESGVTGDVSGFTVIQTIDPSATYGATDIAGAATVQATNAELTELAGIVDEEVDSINNRISEIVGGEKSVLDYYDVAQGGRITFTPITLSEDGDELYIEALPIASVNSMGAGGYGFTFSQSDANKIVVGLSTAYTCVRSDDNTWIYGPNGSMGDATSYNRKYIRIKFVNGNIEVYCQDVLKTTYIGQKTITIGGIGGSQSTISQRWGGKIWHFQYTHAGVTKELEELDGFTKDENVEVVTKSIVIEGELTTIEERLDDIEEEIGDATSAAGTSYNNSASGLSGVNAQDAIDELADTSLELKDNYDDLDEELHGSERISSIVMERGGSINFPAITLSNVGDYVEIVATPRSGEASGAHGWTLLGNTNLSNGLQLGFGQSNFALKDSDGTWICNPNNGQGSYTSTTDTLTARVQLNADSVDYSVKNSSNTVLTSGTYSSLKSFRFDCFGGLLFSPYYWSGTIHSCKIKSGSTTYTLDTMGLVAVNNLVTINKTIVTGEIPQINANIATLSSSVNSTDSKATEAKSVSYSIVDIILKEDGQISLPKEGSCIARISDATDIVYTGTYNLAQLFGFAQGQVTYNGVTVKVEDETLYTISGTATGGGYISFMDLIGYTGADAAVAAIEFPTLPSIGMRVAIRAVVNGTFNCYVRTKSASWNGLLTNSAPYKTYAASELSELGAFGMYLINGTTYSGQFRMVINMDGYEKTLLDNVSPSSHIEKIETDGVFQLGEFTFSVGTALIKEMIHQPHRELFDPFEKYAWFGDSLSELKKLPHLVGEKIPADVYDCSQAGAPLTYSSEYYQPTGFMSLCSQIADGDFTPLVNAINAQYTNGLITEARKNQKLANAATLASLDFSEVAKVVVFAGTNDLSVASATIENIKSGLSSALQTLITAYPNLQIYGILPPYRTDATTSRPNGLTLPQINAAIAEVYENFDIPYLDFFKNCGVNQYNHTQWLSDGLHQNDKGDEMWSFRLAKWLMSI